MRILLGSISFITITTALAAATVPVTLTIKGTASGAPISGTIISFSATGTATLSPIGTPTFSASGMFNTESVTAATSPVNGNFKLDFGAGNTMTGTFSIPAGILLPQLVGQTTTATGNAAITGGTGIYSGTVGSFPALSGSGTATGSATSTLSLSSSGTVTLPGPVSTTTNSTAAVQTFVDTRATATATATGVQVRARLDGGSYLYDQTFNAGLASAAVQAGITQAKAALLQAGAAMVSGPTQIGSTASTGTSTATSETGRSSQRFSYTSVVTGPATIMTGDRGTCQLTGTLSSGTSPAPLSNCTSGTPFTVAAGTQNTDSLTITQTTINRKVTTSATTTTADLYELIGMPGAPPPAPAFVEIMNGETSTLTSTAAPGSGPTVVNSIQSPFVFPATAQGTNDTVCTIPAGDADRDTPWWFTYTGGDPANPGRMLVQDLTGNAIYRNPSVFQMSDSREAVYGFQAIATFGGSAKASAGGEGAIESIFFHEDRCFTAHREFGFYRSVAANVAFFYWSVNSNCGIAGNAGYPFCRSAQAVTGASENPAAAPLVTETLVAVPLVDSGGSQILDPNTQYRLLAFLFQDQDGSYKFRVEVWDDAAGAQLFVANVPSSNAMADLKMTGAGTRGQVTATMLRTGPLEFADAPALSVTNLHVALADPNGSQTRFFDQRQAVVHGRAAARPAAARPAAARP